MNKDEQLVRNHAEKRASTADGIDACVVVYSIKYNDEVWYVADGIDPDDDSGQLFPDNAIPITTYGICSYVVIGVQNDEAGIFASPS